ncbi:MAG TPA: GTPase Era [Gemmatimonadaceae bacterium]|jgi:GTP-binding protein Era|nr:GTPase Era [Gemmatimonadaceae bacterium]
MPRAGIVTVAGKPNVGKSTLLNRIVGEKLSIISSKPQSTRDRVVGIRTTDDSQMVILDTPGLLNPRYPLQEAMRSTALRALEDADVILYVADATEGVPPSLAEAAGLERAPSAPIVTVLNKSDKLAANAGSDGSDQPNTLISALTGEGVAELMSLLEKRLPESPFLYPADEISTQPVRFFVAELVRETVLEQLHDEVPYSVAVQVEEYREERSPLYIRAVIYVERDSQKAIIIGSKGAQIRRIGEAARAKIEAFVGTRVYLDLWVKVLANWRKNPGSLSRFGYQLATGHSK